MFYIADILGGARSMLLGNYIRDQFLVFRDLPMGAAASVAMTVAMGLILLLYYLASRRSGGRTSQMNRWLKSGYAASDLSLSLPAPGGGGGLLLQQIHDFP
jgi:hypothetical protein